MGDGVGGRWATIPLFIKERNYFHATKLLKLAFLSCSKEIVFCGSFYCKCSTEKASVTPPPPQKKKNY